MSEFDHDHLKALTKLCRIHCTQQELDTLAENLKGIFKLIGQLQEVDTEGVAPCNHVYESAKSIPREDEPKEGLNRQDFLNNSPSHIGGMIRVPPVIKF